MFTVCPGCNRQFRLFAEHIAAANGQVRCGFCHEQFNVLERLHDRPLTEEERLNYEQPFAGPQLGISASEPLIEEQVVPKETSFDGDIGLDLDLDAAIEEIGIKADEPERIEIQGSILTSEKTTTRQKERYDFPETEVLLGQSSAKTNRFVGVIWGLACFIGVIALLLQLAWFNRDGLFEQYPQLKPYVQPFCQKVNCQLIRARDVSEIKLNNRDVRLHPRYEDALLVNATMQNELPRQQPYPRVQLTLFDTTGDLLGFREFKPEEYLDDSIDIDAGMPPVAPVHFVLEVTDPTAGAISFEFLFL